MGRVAATATPVMAQVFIAVAPVADTVIMEEVGTGNAALLAGIAAAGKLYRAMIAAESLKWIWYVLALWAALARLKLMPAPLIVGVVVAQFGHWLSLIATKRGN